MFGGEDSVGCARSWQSHGSKLAASRFVDVVDSLSGPVRVVCITLTLLSLLTLGNGVTSFSVVAP